MPRLNGHGVNGMLGNNEHLNNGVHDMNIGAINTPCFKAPRKEGLEHTCSNRNEAQTCFSESDCQARLEI